MSEIRYELSGRSGAELFGLLFAKASLGWIVPVCVEWSALDGLIEDQESGFTLYNGPIATSALAAALRSGERLGPIWCGISVRVPRGDRLQRALLLLRNKAPLAVVEVQAQAVQLRFPQGEPLVARVVSSHTERQRWEIVAEDARRELEGVLGRLRGDGVVVQAR